MNEKQEPLPGEDGPLLATDSQPANQSPAGDISPELIHDPFGEEILDVSRDDFEAMLNEHRTAGGDIREGQIVQARVLRITEATVILEFGFKSEGAVPLDEFKEPDEIEAGQEVEVLLESLEDEDGVVVLSKKKADFLRVWELIKDAYENDRPVKGLLTRKIKGGVTVDIMGVDAFLPGSQIALRRVPNIEDLIGESYEFMIIKLNKRRRNIVVSRRVILERERKKKRTTLVKELLNGQVREGVVKNITDFGAFIDLGGLDGLLHITDMSWGRVGHPSEVVTIGSRLDVKVLDIDWDRERISLGLKQLLPYPWTDIEDRYPVGARVRGKVVSITNYGAFVELQKGVEGLVHISEMSWTRNVRHPSKLVSIGDEIETVVLKVDPTDEKISLGMKQIEEDPWLALPLKYPTGTRLSGTVRNLTSFGAFVEIEAGIDGLVHVSDMSWTRRVEHPSEVVQKGMEVEVMVLDVDSDNKRISLGIKQLQDDPWPDLVTRFTKGYEVDGRVARLQDKGVVMELEDGVEGFVPGSHAAVPADSLGDYYQAGDSVSLRVIASDASDRRIVLEVVSAPERRRAEEPQAETDEGGLEGEPEAAADKPEAAADEAEPAADEAEPAADEPEAAADEPEVAADEPEARADEPPEAADESEDAPDEPGADEVDPEAAEDAPEAAADDSVEAEDNPQAGADEPVAAEEEPEDAEDAPGAVEEAAGEEKDPSDE
ncbi:MAG: 30S ribosomal protein S1 [Gemmatimonadetes bacterium]|nr:30S ribosomal protein S1 [Gemmatimonadota bacterium]MYH53217.1 30S ribosomal protein S1 [Gemmatimonadota bacterium]MYK66894.1 30S ribosomal protein S1 [Gemmatimonadota bacterium]